MIHFLVSEIRKIKTIPDNFEELIWKRENLFITAFGNGTALPHPYKVCAEGIFGAVAVFSTPVDWSGQMIRAVILISLEKGDNPEIQEFYEAMSRILTHEDLLEGLKNCQQWEDFTVLLSLASQE